MHNRILFFGFIFTCAAIGCHAGDMSENYSVIWRRNVFSIVTPPIPVELTAPRAAPSTQVKLTGFAVFPPQKWVALDIQEPGKISATVIIEEGGRAGKIEVQRVDSGSAQVWIRNDGIESVLAFGNVNKRRALAENLHVPIPTTPSPDAGER